MTINSEIRKVGPFIGNGTATAFPFTFKVFQASDLEVVKLNVATNVETVLTLTTNYTVTLNSDQDSNPGGTVTLVGGALASGYTLTVTSDVPYVQPTDLTNQGGFYPDVINDSLDRATIQIQQLGVDVNRSIKIPVSASGIDVELPAPEPNDLIGWDSAGKKIINVDPASIGTVVAYSTAYADVFEGDGVTQDFVLSHDPAVLYNLDVSIQGATQEPTRDYTLAGTTISFTTAPPDNTRVLVKYKQGLPVSSADSQDVRYLPPFGGSVATNVEAKLAQTVSVKDFGAVGDGVTDDWAAIKAAVDAINLTGGTLYFPPGTYYTPYRTHGVDSNWIEITKSGVSFVADPGSVTLQNFLFYVHGSVGALQTIGATDITTGDTQITTASAHNLAAGDYIQLLSQFNTYTSDAGVWQNGSQNPTSLTTPNCRMSEIHKVYSVDSSTAVTLCDNVFYGTYKNTTAGLSYPMTGVSAAQIRKLTPIQGVTFTGLTFKNTTTSNFREFMIRVAVNVTFNSCKWIAGQLPGRHVNTTDTLNLSFYNCTTERNTTGYGGSSWNSFVIGGGSQNVLFDGCSFYGEAQNIDFSPGRLSSDIGYTATSVVTDYSTTQKLTVSNCKMFGCSDGFTTHPSTYSLVATGNQMDGCSTGIRVRSLNNVITGNFIKTKNVGISLSSFFENTLISGNNFEQMVIATRTSGWQGIGLGALGSETMNNNDLQNVIFSNNTFTVTQASTTNAGILWRNYDNGTPPNPSFTLFTSTIKNNLCNHTVKDNSFYGCSVVALKYFNGMTIDNNLFFNGSDYSHYIYIDPTDTYVKINKNYFNDSTTGSIYIGDTTATCRIGLNFGYSTLNNSIASASTISAYSEYTNFNDLNVINGRGLKAIRGTGTSTLNLDAVPNDGTSNAYVEFHSRSTTSGQKYVQMPTLSLDDGVAEPTPPAGGWATLYVDIADGDLKIKFSNGTVKTIVTD